MRFWELFHPFQFCGNAKTGQNQCATLCLDTATKRFNTSSSCSSYWHGRIQGSGRKKHPKPGAELPAGYHLQLEKNETRKEKSLNRRDQGHWGVSHFAAAKNEMENESGFRKAGVDPGERPCKRSVCSANRSALKHVSRMETGKKAGRRSRIKSLGEGYE